MLLFIFAMQGLILGFIPESVTVLIFAVGLIGFAVILRRLMKRNDQNINGEIKHLTK